MALTPEDVVNKRFQPTKFREGYDQDEVDDFLDEVVVELRRLNQENEELRQRLIASDSRINDLQRGVGQPAPVPTSFEQAPAPAPAFAGAPADPSMDPANTNNLLQLARRLHEEHVREGVEKRDALIAEGHASAARVVEEGHAQAARVVEDAQNQTRQQITSLDQERIALENRVEELRNFEREYRMKLKGYIEGQLRELDSNSAVLAGAPSAAAPTFAAGPSSVATPASAPVAPVQYASAAAAPVAAPPPATYPGFAAN